MLLVIDFGGKHSLLANLKITVMTTKVGICSWFSCDNKFLQHCVSNGSVKLLS